MKKYVCDLCGWEYDEEQERTEDLKKAVSDAAYQAKLLKELGL